MVFTHDTVFVLIFDYANQAREQISPITAVYLRGLSQNSHIPVHVLGNYFVCNIYFVMSCTIYIFIGQII